MTYPTHTVTCVCVRCGDACSAQLLGEAAKDTRLLHASIAYQIVPMGGLTTRDLEQVHGGRQAGSIDGIRRLREDGREGRASMRGGRRLGTKRKLAPGLTAHCQP